MRGGCIMFRQLLNGSLSFEAIGCLLCWMIVTGTYIIEEEEIFSFVQQWFGSAVARRKPTTKKVTGSVFPLKEGALSDVVHACKNAALAEVAADAWISRWSGDAWLFNSVMALNKLAGAPGHLRPGKWSRTVHCQLETSCSTSQYGADSADRCYRGRLAKRS